MIIDNLSTLFRDTGHKIFKTSDLSRQIRSYPQNHRMIWGLLLFLIVIIAAEKSGMLYWNIQQTQHSILELAESKSVTIAGTVVESKSGLSYLFLQSETGEQYYVSLPYQNYDEERETYTVWYPTGSKIQVTGRVTLPNDARNPGGFDEAAWLRSKKTGLKLDSEKIELLTEPKGVWKVVYLLHRQIEAVLYEALSEEQAGLSLAMLTGAKHRLNDAFYTMTQSMGIAHIFAVSGLHVGVVGSGILYLFHQMGIMRSRLSMGMLVAALSLYCMLAGLPASSIRAAGMILLSNVAMYLYRPLTAISFLAFMGILILMMNPFLLWSAGFQLSFGVTLSLLLFVKPMHQKLAVYFQEWAAAGISVAVSAWLGSIPLCAWNLYTFSMFSPVYNLLLVPLVSLTVPILLAAIGLSILMPKGQEIFFFPVKLVLYLLQEGSTWLYQCSGWGQWNIGQPELRMMIFYLILLILLWCWLNEIFTEFVQRTVAKMLFVMTGLLIVMNIPTAPQENELLYLDTGQGSCAIFRSISGETVLFDAGAQAKELASVLAWYGVNTVDAVILSHGDTDHIKGLDCVIDTVHVKAIFMEQTQARRESLQVLHKKFAQYGIGYTAIHDQTTLYLKRHQIVMEPFYDAKDSTNQNELTAVLKFDGGAAAFPGDLSVSAIQQFVQKQNIISIWTVPHHGSRYSGSEKLYQLLDEKGLKHAVICAGKENPYGHPHQEVLEWLELHEIKPYHTAEQGAILFLLP